MRQIGDVYEVAMELSVNQNYALTVQHVKLLTAATPAQMVTRISAFADAFKEVWRPQQSTSTNWVAWKAQQVAGDGIAYNVNNCRRSGGDVYENAFGGTVVGGIGGADPVAASLAVVASLRTGLVGRSFNGRAFIPGWSETNVNGDDMLAANRAILQTNADNFALVYGSGGTNVDLSWGVFSRFIASGCKYVKALPRPILTHVQAGNQAGSFTTIQTVTVDSLLAPMRRRKPGVGR